MLCFVMVKNVILNIFLVFFFVFEVGTCIVCNHNIYKVDLKI